MIFKDSKINNNLTVKIATFIIWPFGSFLYSLKNIKSNSSFLIFFLFNILFGYTFIAENKTADSSRYIQEFEKTKFFISDYFYNLYSSYFTFDSNIKDIYDISLTFLVSRFSDNYHILMAIYAIVFSFFYLKSFKFLTNRIEFSISIESYLIAFLFTFSNPIFNINGIRFWTAAWVAVYAIFQIVINKKYLYIFLALVTPLIHISFIIFIALLLIYLISREFERFWLIAFVVSFFIGNIVLESLDYINDYMPKVIQNMIWSYTDASLLSEKLDKIASRPLYANILYKLPSLFLNGLVFVFIYYRKKIKVNTDVYPVYLFILVWMTFINLTLNIPSIGNRFLELAVPFIAYLALITRQHVPIINKLILLIPFVYSYIVYYWIKNMISISDPYLYVGNLFHIIYKNL